MSHLAAEEPFDPFSFVKYARNTGRAYQRQAIELVKICRLFVEASPQEEQHDARFKEAMLAVDVALHSATEAGKKVSDTASNAFDEAQRKLLRYEKSAHPGTFNVNLVSTMAGAKETDQRSLGFFNRVLARRGNHIPVDSSTKPIQFILFKSLPDPKPLVVLQNLSAQPMSSEIVWNFSRYTDERRIALRQNPHFYLDLPTSGNSYGAGFSRESMKDFPRESMKDSGPKNLKTVYVLVDKPSLGRVYLEVEKQKRTFGNVWMPNDVMVFKDIRGKLEGEQRVGNDIQIQSRQQLFWRNEPIIPPENSLKTRELPTLPEVPWSAVTDIRDWKDLIRKKTLPSSGTSVKICVSDASHPLGTNDKAPRAPDKHPADASNQRSDVPSVTNATSSVHVGSQDANEKVPPARGADPKRLPQTQVHPAPLAPVPPNRHTGPKSIAATMLSPPVAMPSVSPPQLAHAHGSPITATPHTMTQSPSPPSAHHSKTPATQEPRKTVSPPQAPSPPSSFPDINPPSKPIDVAPITNPGPGNRTAQQPHLQPTSSNVKSAPIPSQAKVDKPAQDVKGSTKSAKASISFSSFTHVFKPSPSQKMPGAFPGPQMDLDWITVSSHGPTDVQGGGGWLKRLFRRSG